jgi:outer membrane receptor protein involved in Fe transport
VDVLENTPSVQVDQQGNVTLRGSSDFVVLVDGKPSVMRGSDLLKTISAASIKQIEVITNPSAKYDADGTASIINIIQNKEKLRGISGTANISLGTSNKYSGNGLINYRNKKVNVFAGIDYANSKHLGSLSMDNSSYLPAGNQYRMAMTELTFIRKNLIGKAGIDYELNERNALSVAANYGKQDMKNLDQTTSNQRFEGSDSEYYFLSNKDRENKPTLTGMNLDYTHTFGENHTLTISNNYSSMDGSDETILAEYTTDEHFNPADIHSSLQQKKVFDNYQYRLNADYKRPVKSGTFEAGFQYRYENRNDDYVFKNLDVATNEWVINELYTYKLDYVNDIYSAYATYSDKIWGIGYLLGLRSEYFDRTLKFSNNPDPHTYHKFMFYPSVHLNKSIKDKHHFQLSYSRRINRPMPYLLDNTPKYVDPYNVSKGNPGLVPEFTDAFEFSYRTTYKILSFNAQMYSRSTANGFKQQRSLLENGIMLHEFINADRLRSNGLELGMDLSLAKWWKINASADSYYYTIDNQTSDKKTSKKAFSIDTRITSNFTLKWGTRIQLVGDFSGPGVDLAGSYSGQSTADIAISQSFMKGKINIGLSAENIFDSAKEHYTASSENYHNKYVIAYEGMVFMFTATYSFNNFEQKRRGRNDDASFKAGEMF